MIDKNLYFVTEFLKPILTFAQQEFERVWSADNRVRYTSRLAELLELGVDKVTIISIKPEFVKDFSGKEKVFIYTILRLLSIQDQRFGYLLFDLQELLRKRGFDSDRYFYLQSLTDAQFAYELDCKVDKRNPERRYFYRQLSGKFGRNQVSFQELLSEYFFNDIIELYRRLAKRRTRHKGYRDHGSLGSEFSKTLKQQSSDWSLRESEEQKKKSRQDLIEYLQAFSGWI